MKDFLDLLTDRERRAAAVLALLAAAAVLAFAVVSFGRGRSVARALAAADVSRQDYRKTSAGRADAAETLEGWKTARLDLERLAAERLYDAEDAAAVLRLDLKELLGRAGLAASDIRYDYARDERGGWGVVSARFSVLGTYPMLKRFLAGLEAFPKFLVIEKVDFRDTGSGGALKLDLIVAAYHE